MQLSPAPSNPQQEAGGSQIFAQSRENRAICLRSDSPNAGSDIPITLNKLRIKFLPFIPGLKAGQFPAEFVKQDQVH
jgi:hypothetical protein